jgi:serine/threonine protein kinase
VWSDGSQAIKRLKEGASHEAVSRFRREAEVLLMLNEQPGLRIVPVRKVRERESALEIVMARMDGSLEKAMTSFAGNPERAAAALEPIASTLAVMAARSEPIYHRDLKPNNILLIGETAKLTDHGLATPTHGPVTPCPRQGTREYAAPEVFAGHYSDTSDQYSLAVTYYVLRTGTFPFPSPPNPLPKNYSRPAPDLAFVTDAEHPALIRALSPTPQDRFPSSRDFMTDILRAHGLKAVRNEQDQWQVVKKTSRSSSTITTNVLNRTPPPSSSANKNL